jgi:hypothetical protein
VTAPIEPGDHVRIGDGDVDWVVQTIEDGRAKLRSGMTGRLMWEVPLTRLWLRVKGIK